MSNTNNSVNTTNISVNCKPIPGLHKPNAVHTFFYGYTLPLAITKQYSLCAKLFIWNDNNKIVKINKRPQYEFVGFKHGYYRLGDLNMDVKCISRQRLKMCDSHMTPGYVELEDKKTKPGSLEATPIGEHNLRIIQDTAMNPKFRFGLIVDASMYLIICTLLLCNSEPNTRT